MATPAKLPPAWRLHRAPVPEPDEDPPPTKHPPPEDDDPEPHPDPVMPFPPSLAGRT